MITKRGCAIWIEKTQSHALLYMQKVSWIKSVSINLSKIINNLITQTLLQVADHMRSNNGYKNEKNIYFN